MERSESLPFSIKNTFNSACGRSTAGAVIQLKYGNDTIENFILTVAHVPFTAFRRDCVDDVTLNTQVEIFNKHNLYASYNRNGSHVDYAFLIINI
jgi:hypothetical protein